MSAVRELDLSELPELGFGHGANVWWAVLGLIAIEGTMFALLAVSALYLRQAAPSWPPAGIPAPATRAALANVIVLVVSLAPIIWMHGAARRFDARTVMIGLGIGTALALTALALRVAEFNALHVRWDSNAYGSIGWAILGMHAGHLLTSIIENVLIILVMRSPHRQAKHFVDAEVTALYWYFIVVSWLPLSALVFWVPQWR